MSSGGKADTTGIYYFDRFGNLELLYRDPASAARASAATSVWVLRRCHGRCWPLPASPPPSNPVRTARAVLLSPARPAGARPALRPLSRRNEGTRQEFACVDRRGPRDLHPFLQLVAAIPSLVRMGRREHSHATTYPGRIGADESRLTKVLADRRHAAVVSLPRADRDRLFVWLDGNVPFYGTYDQDEQQQQQLGAAVPPPHVQ